MPDVDTDNHCNSLGQSPNPSRLDGLTIPCSSMTHITVQLLPHPPIPGVTHPKVGLHTLLSNPWTFLTLISVLFQWLFNPNTGSRSSVLKTAQEKEHFTARHQMVHPGFKFHQFSGSTQPSVWGSPNWTKPNSVQQCKMTLFYLLKFFSFLQVPPSKNITMRKFCRCKIWRL